MSELKCVLLAIEEAYVPLVERVHKAANEEVDFDAELANLSEAEIAYSLCLLEARIREHLLSEPPAPAFSLCPDRETFLSSRLNLDPETYHEVPRTPAG